MVDGPVSEHILRGLAAGAFAATAFAIARTRAPMRLVGAAFFVAAIGHVLDNDSALRTPGSHASFVTWCLSALAPALFWAFATGLFADERAIPRWRYAPAGFALALSLIAGWSPPPYAHAFSIFYNLLTAVLILHAFVVIWRGAPDDLVEPRRRLRVPVIVAGAAYVLAIAAGDLGSANGFALEISPRAQAAILALLALSVAAVLLGADADLLGAARPIRSDTPVPGPDVPALARLGRALDEEEIWRREKLTIGALAAHLAMPEHRLRRLINGTLGYRNFASLINERRIAAARIVLADPAQASKSVAAIAFELGFGSLGPFNRAFKEATGATPTEWRAAPKRENSGRD